MIEIKDLLNRFRDILFKEEDKKEIIRNIISKIIRTEINSKDIEIKKGIIYLNIKPIYKNEIFIKKEQIFLRLKEVLGEKTPQNIR
ncbi:MAG: hypothetical protein WCP17_01955 [bacterium]